MGPYIQSYRVSAGPLALWAIVAAICAAALVFVAVSLVLRRPRHVVARRLIVTSLLGAALDGVLAWRIWDAYGTYTPLGGCRWAPPGVCERFYAEVAQANTLVTLLGCAAVLATAGACTFAALALRRSTPSDPRADKGHAPAQACPSRSHTG